MSFMFGVSNSSPAGVADLLTARKLIRGVRDIAIVPLGTSLQAKAKPTRNIVFVLTIADALRNLKVLNSGAYEDCSVFIFASPLRLIELTNLVLLDLTYDAAAKGFGFHLRHSIDLAKYRSVIKRSIPSKAVVRNTREHLTVLTDSVKKGSLLTPLMTFIYTLPSSTLQTPVKIAVAKILALGKPLSSLDSLVAEISEYALSVAAKDKLIAILTSDVGIKYTEAFAAYRKAKKTKGTAALASIAKKFDVMPYEIRYLMSVMDAATKEKVAKGHRPAKALAKPVKKVVKKVAVKKAAKVTVSTDTNNKKIKTPVSKRVTSLNSTSPKKKAKTKVTP